MDISLESPGPCAWGFLYRRYFGATLLMQAASLLDGFSFNLFPPFEKGLAAPEVTSAGVRLSRLSWYRQLL